MTEETLAAKVAPNEKSALRTGASLSIGAAANRLGLSIDTLRYYERIRLVPPLERDAGGRRRYREQDLSRLRFVMRAQAVGFSLDEIRELLQFRARPAKASRRVRGMVADKLDVVTNRLAELEQLRDELTLLVNLCSGTGDDCPILEQLDDSKKQAL